MNTKIMKRIMIPGAVSVLAAVAGIVWLKPLSRIAERARADADKDDSGHKVSSGNEQEAPEGVCKRQYQDDEVMEVADECSGTDELSMGNNEMVECGPVWADYDETDGFGQAGWQCPACKGENEQMILFDPRGTIMTGEAVVNASCDCCGRVSRLLCHIKWRQDKDMLVKIYRRGLADMPYFEKEND